MTNLVRLSEMILHETALEQFPWLSAQILNRWRRQQVIRAFKGKDGKVAYPMSDLEMALTKELGWDESEDQEASGITRGSGSTKSQGAKASTDIGTMSEADALSERLWKESLSKKPKKASSSSSEPPRRRAETPERSISSLS